MPYTELEIIRARETIQLRGETSDFAKLLNNVARPIQESYKESLRNDLIRKESALVIIRNKQRGQKRTPNSLTTAYLSQTSRIFFEDRAMGLIGGPDMTQKIVGAVILDVNSGFKHVVMPLIIADQAYQEAAIAAEEESDILLKHSKLPSSLHSNAVAAGMEAWGEWRRLLIQDSTGYLLVDEELAKIRDGRTKPQGNEVLGFLLVGAELARDTYKEVYPKAVALLQ